MIGRKAPQATVTVDGMVVNLLVLDHRTLVQLAKMVGPSDHLTPHCSLLQTAGVMPCDCGALAVAWAKLGAQDWERLVPVGNLAEARDRIEAAQALEETTHSSAPAEPQVQPRSRRTRRASVRLDDDLRA